MRILQPLRSYRHAPVRQVSHGRLTDLLLEELRKARSRHSCSVSQISWTQHGSVLFNQSRISTLSRNYLQTVNVSTLRRDTMNSARAQLYARWIGVLYLITIVAGGWGESHVPDTLLLANDLTGTAHKVAASVVIFRSSFAAYLIEATCDITLNVLLYALLRPTSRNLALLAVCFGLMGTATFAAGEMLYFAAALPSVDADVVRAISSEAQATLTYFCLTIFGYCFGIFAIFYGVAAAIRGYLILRSGYLPRVLGAIVMLGGASFIVKNVVIVITPHHDKPYIILPMFLTLVSMALWMLFKGINQAQWDAKQVGLSNADRRL